MNKKLCGLRLSEVTASFCHIWFMNGPFSESPTAINLRRDKSEELPSALSFFFFWFCFFSTVLGLSEYMRQANQN